MNVAIRSVAKDLCLSGGLFGHFPRLDKIAIREATSVAAILGYSSSPHVCRR
jgi:hypothetical protein